MASGNLSYADKVKKCISKLKDACARIYRPGIPIQDSLQYLIDWVGDKNALIGAAGISLVVFIFYF